MSAAIRPILLWRLRYATIMPVFSTANVFFFKGSFNELSEFVIGVLQFIDITCVEYHSSNVFDVE